MCGSIRVLSGKQNHYELWDKEFIIGNGPYTILGRAGEVKVWKGELKNQRKSLTSPGLQGNLEPRHVQLLE